MRIASISKSLAAVGLLQLYQRNLLDLDAPIQQYLPEFPRKEFEGEEVEISCRLLLSHLAGIRHYQKNQGQIDKGEVKGQITAKTFDVKVKVIAWNNQLVCVFRCQGRREQSLTTRSITSDLITPPWGTPLSSLPPMTWHASQVGKQTNIRTKSKPLQRFKAFSPSLCAYSQDLGFFTPPMGGLC